MDLPKVQRGEPVTAEAWNQVVAAINGTPNVSIMRGKRTKGGGISAIKATACASSSASDTTTRTIETDEIKFAPSQFYFNTNDEIQKKTRSFSAVTAVTVENNALVFTFTSFVL